MARQTSLQDNIRDVFRRLQLQSDPLINSFRRIPFCSICNIFKSHWTRGCPKRKNQQSCQTLDDVLDEEIETYLGESYDTE